MALLEVLGADEHVGSGGWRDVGDGRAARRDVGEGPLDQRADLRMLEVADRGDDEVRRDVGVGEVAAQRGLIEGRHRVGLTENRPAERVIGPEPAGEQLVDEVVGRVLDHLDLFEDDLLLALDLGGVEGRRGDQVREHVDGQRQMLVEHLDEVAGVFLGGEGVEVPADRVDLLGDVFGGAGGGALEEHVLDEVGDAFVRRGFVP